MGVDELVFYWPTDPEMFERAPKLEQAFERIASETIPTLREASAATSLRRAGRGTQPTTPGW